MYDSSPSFITTDATCQKVRAFSLHGLSQRNKGFCGTLIDSVSPSRRSFPNKAGVVRVSKPFGWACAAFLDPVAASRAHFPTVAVALTRTRSRDASIFIRDPASRTFPVSGDEELTSLFQPQTRDLTELGHALQAPSVSRGRHARRDVQVRSLHGLDHASGPITASSFDFSERQRLRPFLPVAASCGELPAHSHANLSQTCWMVTQRQRKTSLP